MFSLWFVGLLTVVTRYGNVLQLYQLHSMLMINPACFVILFGVKSNTRQETIKGTVKRIFYYIYYISLHVVNQMVLLLI